MKKKNLFRSAALISLGLLLPSFSPAATLQEITQVKAWGMTASQLTQLLPLAQNKRLKIELEDYPTDSTVAAWKKLVLRGVEVSFRSTVFPTRATIDRINGIGFKNLEITFPLYPLLPEDSDRISKLKSPPGARLVVRFDQKRFPLPDEIDAFLAVKSNPIYLFETDYWPSHLHVDLLNELPQKKILAVKGVYPSAQQAYTASGITDLEKILMIADFDPFDPEAAFEKLGSTPLQWIRTGSFPSIQSLQALAGSQARWERELILDLERDLTPMEKARLDSTSVKAGLISNLDLR